MKEFITDNSPLETEMKRVFLYGTVSHNFEEVSAPFIQASGGAKAKVALLMQGCQGWERYLPRYRDPWLLLGAKEVIPTRTRGP